MYFVLYTIIVRSDECLCYQQGVSGRWISKGGSRGMGVESVRGGDGRPLTNLLPPHPSLGVSKILVQYVLMHTCTPCTESMFFCYTDRSTIARDPKFTKDLKYRLKHRRDKIIKSYASFKATLYRLIVEKGIPAEELLIFLRDLPGLEERKQMFDSLPEGANYYDIFITLPLIYTMIFSKL